MTLSNYDLLLANNETLRLFIVVLIEPASIKSNPPLFYTIFAFEMLNLFFSFCSFWSIVFLMPRFQLYHQNVIRLIQLYFGSYYVTIISRSLTMSFQLGLIPTIVWIEHKGGLGSLPGDFFLLVVCVVRIMFTAQYACIIPGMLIERAFATFFVTDYEQRRRPWVAFIIYGLSMCYTLSAAAMITTGNLSYTFCAIAFLIIGLGVSSFIIFYRYNKRKLYDLNSKYRSESSYTLSTRYQVTENVKVMRKILIMAMIFCVFIFVAMIMTVFCFLVYDFFSFEGQILAALLEMWVAFSANIITALMFLMNMNWTNTTLRHLFSKEDSRTEKLRVEKPQQTDMYFAIFAKQW